jgi:hypothetical protein
MTLEKALKLVQEKYESAKNLDYIHNPLAYALYKVWKMADEPLDINPLCGNCAYAVKTHAFGSNNCYIECTNRGKLPNRSGVAHIKQRTAKACKRYRQKEGADNA